MAMEPLFTWVHLSDIHFGHGDAAYGWDQRLVLRALRDDLASRSEPRRIDAIFVTGDIAFSGKAEQYAEARAWLDDVGRAVGVGPGRVFVVPGNHDVDRAVDRDRDIARLLRDLRNGDEPLDTALAHAPDRAKLAVRMAAYLDFAAGLAPACLGQAAQPREQRLFWRHREKHGPLRLRILGLNTALLSADDHDQGRLAAGTEQIAKALIEASLTGDELVIALSHHPLHGGWLADETAVASWLRKHAHVHLFGHIHDASSEQARSGAGSTRVRIAAGAAHAERQPAGVPSGHGYTIASVLAKADGALTLRLWPRRWSDRNKIFVLDVDNVPDGKIHADLRLGLALELPEEPTIVTRRIPAIQAPEPERLRQRVPAAPLADPLAQALDDALMRKLRLEGAGQSTTKVLAEIRKLKRKLRRGGVLRPGDVFGHDYLLAERIGQGGFGTVWRARDLRTHDEVAVKVLHPNLAGARERRQRFFRGARIMTELAHPAVVRVRQVEEEDDGFYYFVMDFLAGGNLQDAVIARRLPHAQIEPLILRVGEALAEAHKRGIVHRDVKPSNILLDGEGQPYLTDFDLVTAPDTTGGTRTGALGTFLYAPPEMMERPQDADARADVYGLGMTMAFMLHGELLPRTAMGNAARFVWGLACAARLRAVLARAVAWEPKHRFEDAEAFCEALREAIRAPSTSESTPSVAPPMLSRTTLPAGVFTLRELLQAIRDGLAIACPILILVEEGTRNRSETAESTSRTAAARPLDWAEQYGREYASHKALVLELNTSSPGLWTIGRSRRCDVCIKNDSVSKVHASLHFDQGSGECNLVDDRSRNGTSINGESLEPGVPTQIWSGVYISFGDAVFVFIDPPTLRKLAGATSK